MFGDTAKRSFDIAVSAFGLAILSPLLLAIGIVVAASSPGGALFRQSRVGRHGATFTLLKFRSMTISDRSSIFTPGQSDRTTPVGRILRRSKLDELPQLWNVFVGDMSLVGPRPEVEAWTRVYPERWKTVLDVRPGITDVASIEFRDEESILASATDPEACYRDQILPRKLALAESYARNRSFRTDLGILARTVIAVLGRGTGPTPSIERQSEDERSVFQNRRRGE